MEKKALTVQQMADFESKVKDQIIEKLTEEIRVLQN
jgi:hypothetical protein